MPTIRCTRPHCRHVFEVAADRLGKNLPCPACGARITAVPSELAERLAAARPLDQARAAAPLPFEALLEDIRSLWNVGSMFRTADAAGIRHLHLAGITGTPPRKEIGKTALGADDVVAWSHAAEAAARARELRTGGRMLLALERTERAVDLHALARGALLGHGRDTVCLLVGNEVAGLSKPLLELADRHVALPMRGIKRSLNVAVAFGVAALHVARLLEERAADG